MKIGVISDTHIPKAALDLPSAVYKEFVNVDLILHAGDFVEISVLNKLKKLAPIKAVCGNMDTEEIRNILPKKDVIKVKGFKIGIVHGSGPPNGLIKSVKNEFANGINVIIFGHSHTPCNERIGKTLFFNPGSPTDSVFAPYKSYGIIEITGKDIIGKIKRI